MTNKDIERLLVFFDDNDMTWDEYASLKVKLEEELEKAKKYDSIIEYVGNHKGLFSHNVKEWIEKLEQENKQFKEDKKITRKEGDIKFASRSTPRSEFKGMKYGKPRPKLNPEQEIKELKEELNKE